MTNIHSNKKKDLGIAKAVSVPINGINIEIDIGVSEAKKYTIIVGNEWLKKAKALLDYKLYNLSSIQANQKEKQSNESDDDKSNEKKIKKNKKKLLNLPILSSLAITSH
ncbi:hypothetical protein G9A89_016825 [Geosiphon pyriformis]|nr:hypothetical protein G9A89_016825 [Geosiphon pyriformis]